MCNLLVDAHCPVSTSPILHDHGNLPNSSISFPSEVIQALANVSTVRTAISVQYVLIASCSQSIVYGSMADQSCLLRRERSRKSTDNVVIAGA